MRPWAGVQFVEFKDKSDWLKQRLEMGIGGSESAAILGLSPYSCSAQVFYEKIGLARKGITTSLPMIIGIEDEDKIAKLWSHYDANIGIESIPANYEANKVIRRPIKLNRIIWNPSYEALFANPDRLFKHGKGRGVLEIKTINHWEAQKWESGVPIHYLVQIQHYMLVCNVPYAELAILEANNRLDIIPFERSAEIQDRILDQCTKFWNDVRQARYILANGGIEMDIEHLVPPPDGSDAYTEFLKERYKDGGTNPDEIIRATEDQLQTLAELVQIKEEADRLAREAALREQRLRDAMGEAPVLDFGERIGRITWRADKNGKRSFKMGAIRKDEALSLASS